MLDRIRRYFFPQPVIPQPDSACGVAFTSCEDTRHAIGSVTRGGEKYRLYCDGWDDQMIDYALMKKLDETN